ncbi:MAG: DUF1549 domain-containing protein, partial [Verrucomicrobiales bacterium]|nr:DUF1549 domain-containing protein [Verrucomicrobiales bacterium]
MIRHLFITTLLSLATFATLPAATPEALEFFENRIRPVLAQDCYECHATATKKKGGLLLDSRPGWQAGGDSGPAIMPGDPDSSLLIQSIRHTHGELAMPKNGAPLDPSVVQDFVRWVRDGAADPRDHPPSAAEVEADTAWPAIRDRRAQWWAFQPLRKETDSQSVLPLSDRIDAEIDRALNAAGLQSNKAADAATLQRRLNLLLTGLPPSSEDALAFEKAYADHPAHAISMEVDRLLADPGFGETWARHWMDWVRYAETHGSEGDPAIPHAWRYRDYLIRALNADIPYPQLLQEHLAGDLLTQPRLRKGINESALGTAHYRMVLHGFTPTDPLDELTTFTDNQIDVVSKAFLGVTVSCARCHNHKFDPISQEDFYALYGIFASCKPALIDVSDAPQRATIQTELTKLRQRIADQLATAWETALQQLPARLQTLPPDKKTASADTALALWNSASANSAADLSQLWNQLQQQAQQQRDAQKAAAKNAPFWSWDARTDLLQPFWHASATGSGGHVTPAGAFHVPESGDHLLDSLLPAGIHSHLGSETDRGVLISHRFPAEKGHRVWIRIAGGEKARARFVIQNYPRRGTVYPKTDLTNSNPQWIEWDLDYFDGDTAHLEITTEADQPVETANAPRSWFSVAAVQCLPEGQRPTEPLTTLAALLPPDPASPQNLTDLAGRYQIAARSALQAWRSGQATDAQITFLNTLLTAGLLPTTTSEIPEAAPLLQRYQRLVETLPPPVRAP